MCHSDSASILNFFLMYIRAIMYLCEKKIVFAAFLATSCFGKITIETSNFDKSGLVEAAVQIIESCYGTRITGMGFAGSSTGLISKTLWSRRNHEIILIDNTSRIVNNGPIRLQNPHKLHVFVITGSSSSTLTKTISEIKASIYWNHMAAFLVLDWPLSHRGCTNAFEMLWSAWEMNILNAKFLCYDLTKGLLIYTFNPYTSQAPNLWQFVKTYSGKNDHPWTLFVRKYEDSKGVCNNLDFEKANDLGGYEIRVSSTSFGSDRVKSNNVCLGVYDNIYCKILFSSLNATPKVFEHHSLNSIGYVDSNGNPNGILAEVMNGSSDIGVTGRFITIVANFTSTYPHLQTEIRSLTQHTGYKSQLSKINSVIDGISRAGLYLVFLITILFFKFFVHQPVTVAYLSTLRVISNAILTTIPKTVALRIYLGSLFLFVLTIQGIYQGQLASLLSAQQPKPNVNTMRDLVELGHTIYGFRMYRSYFDDPQLEGRYVDLENIICTEYVLKNPRAACVGDTRNLIYDAIKFELHMSRDTLVLIYEAFPIRPDWPLEPKVNAVLMRAREGRLASHLIDDVTHTTYNLLEAQEVKSNEKIIKVLTLDQLNFAFAILGIGLGCAAIIFGIEIGVGRLRRRN